VRARRPDDAVLVGAGCVSAFGYGAAAAFDALDRGHSAVRPADETEAGPDGPAVARAEAPLLRMDVPREMETQIKFLSGSGELAVEATAEAVRAAGDHAIAAPPERRGLYLSQMDSEDWLCREFDTAVRAATEGFTIPLEQAALNRACGRFVKPFFMLESLKNNAFSFLATMFELRGANTSVAGFAGPTHLALDMAVRSLARGSLDIAFVVAAARPTSTAALTEMAARGIRQPAGDGAAALILRRRADAAGAQVSVLGLGCTTRRVDPEGGLPSTPALADAAREALAAAEVGPGELRAIVAPGLGEADLEQALEALPAAAGVAQVTWTTGWGHCALAAETMQVALAAESLRRGRVPRGEPWPSPGAVLVLGAGLLGQASAAVLA